MNQTGKILLGIGAAAVTVMALMKFGSGSQAVNRRRDPEKAAADLAAKEKPKDPNAGKPEAIKAVRESLQGSPIDSFDGMTDQQFSKLSVDELKALKTAIETNKRYRSESEFRRAESKAWKDITLAWSKITGKTLKQ